MTDLRSKIIRLAYQKKHLRNHLLPLVTSCKDSSGECSCGDSCECTNCGCKTSETSGGGTGEGPILEVLGVPANESIDEYYTPSEAAKRLLGLVGKEEAKNMVEWAETNTHSPFYKKMKPLVSKD